MMDMKTIIFWQFKEDEKPSGALLGGRRFDGALIDAHPPLSSRFSGFHFYSIPGDDW